MNSESNKTDLKARSFEFAVDVIGLCKLINKNQENKILLSQLIRSATSIGANLEEAAGARTRAEFTNCMNIAKKEARESNYWLRLIDKTNEDLDCNFTELIRESNEIISILTASIKTLDQNRKS